MASGTAPTSTERVLADDDIAGIRQLYPPHRLAAGTYTVRQVSSGRFLDADETSVDDPLWSRTNSRLEDPRASLRRGPVLMPPTGSTPSCSSVPSSAESRNEVFRGVRCALARICGAAVKLEQSRSVEEGGGQSLRTRG